jgi:FkbM family methyltransferase
MDQSELLFQQSSLLVNNMMSHYTATTDSSNDTARQRPIIRDTLLHIPDISAEYVWDQLIIEVSNQKQQQQKQANDNKLGVIIEVGMHTAKQCVQAATAHIQVHCIEPSPKSYERIQTQIEGNVPKQIQEYIHLYQYAAGAVSNQSIPFISAGSTGDHVGIYDMWNMKPGIPTDPKLVTKQGTTIHVPTIRLDDIISNHLVDDETNVYLLKIDTQGFEPSVIQGLSNSLLHHKVQYILMEYWPHGMDLMMDQSTSTTTTTTTTTTTSSSCTAAINVLQQLLDYNYILYALPPNTHPRAPVDAKRYMKTQYYNNNHTTTTMFTNVTTFCQWFYSIEQLYPSNDFKMGYWADIFAVAASTTAVTSTTGTLSLPYTDIGKLIMQSL